MQLNHSELEYKYPTHLVTLVNMFFEKVQYCRTTQNSCERPLHTLSLRTEEVQEGSRRFDAVEPLRTRVQISYSPRSPCGYVHSCIN